MTRRASPLPAQSQPVPAAAVIVADSEATWQGYPGAKGGAGVFQTIINQIPPHDVFIEAFAGSAHVTRHKRPAQSTIVIDCDGAACVKLRGTFGGKVSPQSSFQFRRADLDTGGSTGHGVTVVCDDACRYLKRNRDKWNERTVVYCDPPYLRSARSCQRDYYASEFDTEEQHAELLEILCGLPVPVLLSGYRSPLYDRILLHWRRIDYTAMTHGGPTTESLWLNFPEPFALHDYRYLGRNFRERERIKRKRNRWRTRLLTMPALERMSILAAIAELPSAGIAARNDAAGVIATNGETGSPPQK